ncbi:MAG: glycosyltransferase, partial [Acidobacteriota bacterium]
PALREAEVVLASPSLVDLLPAFVHRWRCGSRVGVFAFHLGDARAAGDLGRPLRARLARLASAPERALLRLADRVFTSATDVAEQLAALGVTRARIVRRPPIVDVAAIRAATPRSAPDILFVGRLVARKGVFDLIEAASGLRTETGLEATVGLVGEGEEADALRRAIAAARLEGRVKLLGGVDDDTLYGLMRGARVLVLPSFEEGYGLVIAEALVAGAAVVAYALPHYDEAFGDAIVQTSPGDIAALRSALQRALHAPRDIERASAVAALRLETPERAARAVIATFAQPGVSSAGSGGPSSLSRSGSESGTSRR